MERDYDLQMERDREHEEAMLQARLERLRCHGPFLCNPDEAYAADDPKHPTHADLWDMREGK